MDMDVTLTPEFDQICSANKIFAVNLLQINSDLLRHLDIYRFNSLKPHSHGLAADKMVYEHLSDCSVRITKDDFIELYKQARKAAFKIINAKSVFKTAGLVPYDSEYAISRVPIRLNQKLPHECPVTPTRASGSEKLQI